MNYIRQRYTDAALHRVWSKRVQPPNSLPTPSPEANVRAYSEVQLKYKDVPYTARIYGQRKEGVDPIVFSFGGYQHHRSSLPFVDRFAPKTLFCTVELPGTGQSMPLDHNEYSLDFLGECYAHAWKTMELGPACVLAGSFAVLPAMLAVGNDPSMASKLVLAAAPVSLGSNYTSKIHKMIDMHKTNNLDGYADSVVDFLIGRSENERAVSSRILTRIMRRQILNASRIDHERAYENAMRTLQHYCYKASPSSLWQSSSSVIYPKNIPSLFVFGQYDEFTPASKMFPVAKEMEDAHVVEMDDSDHLVHIERQNDFLDVFEDFLDGTMQSKTYGGMNWLWNGPSISSER